MNNIGFFFSFQPILSVNRRLREKRAYIFLLDESYNNKTRALFCLHIE